MSITARKIALLVVLAVIGLGLVAWEMTRLMRPRAFNVRSATITRIDPARRSGEVEFIHPKSGQLTIVAAENIPEDCEIEIDGHPATVDDVRVGDTVAITGMFYPQNQSAVPRSIHVTRMNAATQPTSAATVPSTQP